MLSCASWSQLHTTTTQCAIHIWTFSHTKQTTATDKNWSASPKDCSTDWKGATFYSGMKHNWFPDVTSEDRNRKISCRFVLFSSAYCVNVKYTLLAEKELNSWIFSSFFTECWFEIEEQTCFRMWRTRSKPRWSVERFRRCTKVVTVYKYARHLVRC